MTDISDDAVRAFTAAHAAFSARWDLTHEQEDVERVRAGLAAALPYLLEQERTEGERCQACGKVYQVVYWLPDEIWRLITPRPDQPAAGLLCVTCADGRTRAAGRILEWTAQ